jgi:hypothetical protein
MAFLENILVPLLKFLIFTAVYTGIFAGLIYIAYRMFFTARKRVRFFYKIMRKQPKEEDVAWCMDAVEKGLSEMDIRKHCLLKGVARPRTEELCYIFTEVKKELKGGTNENGGHKKGYGKVELPKID